MDQSETDTVSIKHSTHRRLKGFEQDEIGVKKIADVIEFVISNLDSQPFVVGLNSSWGTGKTEFLRMWSKQLDTKGCKFVAFNSWENDFLQDPLVCLLGELEKVFKPDQKSFAPKWEGVKEAAGFLIKKAIPGVVKHATVGVIDVEGIGEAIGAAAEEAAEKAIESHNNIKSSLNEFRAKLAILAKQVREETGHPLLVIVDELDRCRPSFAIEMLEAIKHLFEVENLVFVLAYDGDQLACSTQAIYGPKFDGRGYLQRFFNLELQLPRNPAVFLEGEANRMGLGGWVKATSTNGRHCGTGADAITTLKALAVVHQFELRTIQRILTRFSVAAAALGTENNIYSYVFSPIVVMSVVRPNLLEQYFSGAQSSNAIIETVWPVEKMHRLSSASDSDSTMIWAYASSIFFFTHLDFIEHKRLFNDSTWEDFSGSVLESRKSCHKYYRIQSAFEHLSNDYKTEYWDHSDVKQDLEALVAGSSDLFRN